MNRTGLALPRGVRAAAVRGVRAALRRRGPPNAAVDVAFVGDAEIRRQNRRWFRRRRPTDVMAFPIGEDGFLGDIVISIDAARRQAHDRRHPVAREVEILAAHGAFHLLGEEDRTERGRRRMERLVGEALARHGG